MTTVEELTGFAEHARPPRRHAPPRACTAASSRARGRADDLARPRAPRDRAVRPRVREPLPVRGDGRPARRHVGRGDREDRRRRPGDAPRGGEEPRVRGRRSAAPTDYEAVLDELARDRRGGRGHPAPARGAGLRAPPPPTTPPSPRWLRGERAPPETARARPRPRPRLSYGENPHQEAAYYAERGARTHLLARVEQLSRASRCRSTTSTTSRPRGGSRSSSTPTCLRDREAREPVRGRGRGHDRARPTRARSPAIRSRRTAASSCSTAPVGAALGEALAEQFVEVLLAPGLDATALEALRAKEGDAGPGRPRAASPACRRARPQARPRRRARPGRRPTTARSDSMDDGRLRRARTPRPGRTSSSRGRS